jgi:hypothetical protein
MRNNLLPLVRDFHGLALSTDRSVRRRFLCCDRELLVLELGKRDGREVILVDVARDVLQEQRLVRAHVFVGDCGGS